MKVEPAIATWELWSVANMLIFTHGEDAEAHAQEKITQALSEQDEGGEIVWTGVLTQLQKIRRERALK